MIFDILDLFLYFYFHKPITFIYIYFYLASALLAHDVVALIEGSDTKTSACALSSVAGIPLIRFHGDSRLSDQCENAIQMSSDFRDFAHATLDILNTFGWTNIAVVFDGKNGYH